MSAATRGQAALEAKDFQLAITNYTQAIAESPDSPLFHIQRSTAYQRAKNFSAALGDAEKGLVFAQKRGKRELKAQAQLRRGIALYHIKHYADAKACFGWSRGLNDKEKSLAIWDGQVAAKLKGLSAEDVARMVTVSELPSVSMIENIAAASASPIELVSITTTTPAVPNAQPSTSAPAQTPKDKIRHDWYQNNEFVYFSLLVKAAPKDKTTVIIEADSLSISFPLNGGSSYDFFLDPLFSEVDVSKSSFKVLSTKIEIILAKSNPGNKWKALESTEPRPAANSDTSSDTFPMKEAILADARPKETAPAYPTSSKNGPKDWDKISANLSKTKKKGDDEDDDEGDVDDEDSGNPDFFFKKLYAGASDEARRAMNKSYSESGGTTLSTNWEDISKRTLTVDPPDGMVAKKWGE